MKRLEPVFPDRRRTIKERMFDWAFPTGAAAFGAALALIAYGKGVGVGEARAEAVREKVEKLETRTAGDHDVLLRVDERTVRIEKQVDAIGDVARLAAEFAAFRKWIEEARAAAGWPPIPPPVSKEGSPPK